MTSEKVDVSAPICLIENEPNQKLVVRKEASEILAKIHQPLMVVAIVGLYRTGKSYLMNRLTGKNKGFPLGCTVQAETKGIWMWCHPHPLKSDCMLVLLDTEGLGDVQKGNSENDSWIFALAVLLSSTIVYNSIGTIDSTALEKLQYVAELIKNIAKKSKEESSTEFATSFPDFIWAVRDFYLQLKVEGRPISEDEYLETALQLHEGDTEQIRNLNMVKSCIRECFPSRKCFVFDRPVGREKLDKLEELSEDELEEDFLETSSSFCQHVWETCKPKRVPGGHLVPGRILVRLAESYVKAFNSGAVPSLGNTVLALAQIENVAAVREAISHYEEQMGRKLMNPKDTLEELREAHIECEMEAACIFIDRVFLFDIQPFQVEFEKELNKKKEMFFKKNEEMSYKRCQAKLMELARDFEEEIRMGTYAVPGGYARFLKEQNKIKAKYQSIYGKRLQAHEALENFLKSNELMGKNILRTDKALTDQKKEIEEQRIQAEAAERELKVLEQELVRTVAMLEDQRQLHAYQLQLLKEKMEEELKNMEEDAKEMFREQMKGLLRKRFLETARVAEKAILGIKEQEENAHDVS